MSERLPGWAEVARILGERLENHAGCPEHPEETPVRDCPFCEDRIAYRLFERKMAAETARAGRTRSFR